MAAETPARIPQGWRPAEKHIAVCARCGDEGLKRNMVALYRLRKGTTLSILLHFCERCYFNFLDDYGIGEG